MHDPKVQVNDSDSDFVDEESDEPYMQLIHEWIFWSSFWAKNTRIIKYKLFIMGMQTIFMHSQSYQKSFFPDNNTKIGTKRYDAYKVLDQYSHSDGIL